MEIEIQGIPQSLRPSYQARIKASKADLTRYKKLSKDVHAQLSRAELLAREEAQRRQREAQFPPDVAAFEGLRNRDMKVRPPRPSERRQR